MTEPYSSEAAARISGLGKDVIIDFLELVPPNSARSLLGYIRVRGFRDGSAAELDRQRRILARRLSYDGADRPAATVDWRCLGEFWVRWSYADLSDQTLSELIPKVTEDGSPESKTEIITEIFSRCKELALTKGLSRDDLNLFVLFAPFDEARFGDIVELATTEADLKAEQAIKGLPNRVDELEDQLKGLRQAIQSVDISLRSLPDSRPALGTLSDSMKGAEERITALDDSIKGIHAAVNQIELAVSSHSASIDSVQNELVTLQATVSSCGQGIESLKDALSQLRQEKVAADIAAAEAEADATAILVDGRGNGSATSAAHEQTPARASSGNTPLYTGNSVRLHARTIEEVFFPLAGGVKKIASGQEAVRALQRNLTWIGIVPSSAGQVAHEVTAAAFAGQQVTFKGSLAFPIADVAASTFAGTSVAVLDIPIGLSEPITENGDISAFNAIILDNANVGSYGLYGAELRHRITRCQVRADGSRSCPLLFATAAAVPVGLPLSADYCELGPVIDTDTLDWSEGSGGRPLQSGDISSAACPELDVEESREVWRDLQKEFVAVCGSFSALESRTVVNAIALLLATDVAEDAAEAQTRAFHSIVLGWLIPYCLSVGCKSQTIREAIGTSRFLGALASDNRLARLIK